MSTVPLHPSLTAIFTPPPDCTRNYFLAGTEYTNPPIIEATISQVSSCFAPGWTPAANIFGRGQNTWLGAPLCPDGQTIAQTIPDVKQSITGVCCSSGWGSVFSNLNALPTTTYFFHVCQSTWTNAVTTVRAADQKTDIATLSGPGKLESTAEYVFIFTKAALTAGAASSTAVSTSSTSSASSTSSTPSTPPASFTSPASSATSSTTNASSSAPTTPGLRTDMRIGVGVGMSLGVVLVIGVLAFLALRYRKKGHTQRRTEVGIYPCAKSEVSGGPKAFQEMLAEQSRFELDAWSHPRELP